MEQLERIGHFEAVLNDLCAAAEGLRRALYEFEALQPAARELAEYYSGPDWRQDYLDDERGALPADLPRGVLSEDGAYNALLDNRELLQSMRELAERFLTENQ